MLRNIIFLSISTALFLSSGCTTNTSTRTKIEDRSTTNNPNFGSTVISTPAENAATTSPGDQGRPYVASPSPQSSPQKQSSTAVASLVNSAEASIRHGDYKAASAALERALRHDQKNADLWHRLAQVRLRQGEYAQVESLSLKSNALARGNKPLMAKNWTLIGKARRIRGDGKGADEAEAKAYQLLH
jgi:Flp pilus assembly protein TadD